MIKIGIKVWKIEKDGRPPMPYYSGLLSDAIAFAGDINVLPLGMINSKTHVIARPTNSTVTLTYCADPYQFDGVAQSLVDCDESRYFFKLEISYAASQNIEFSVTVNAAYENDLFGDCGNFDGLLNKFESGNAPDGYYCNDGVHASCNVVWPNTSPTMYNTKVQCLLDCWT